MSASDPGIKLDSPSVSTNPYRPVSSLNQRFINLAATTENWFQGSKLADEELDCQDITNNTFIWMFELIL